jgi:CRP-like cAMP-binding protein
MHKVEVLSQSPLFDMLSSSELEYLANLAKPRRLAPGEVVFNEGEVGDSLYVLGEGEVEVLRHGEDGAQRVLSTLKAPTFFGELSIIDKEVRSATIRAKTEATLLHLTADNLALFRRQYRDGFVFLIMNIARVVSGRLREANSRLAARL